MDRSGIRKEIAALINSIKEHSDNIGNSSQIPQLELELILHKIEKLYQKSIVFNYLNSIPEERLKTTVQQNSAPVPVKVKEEPRVENKPPAEKIVQPETISKPEVKTADLFGNELPKPEEKPKLQKEPPKKEAAPVTVSKPANLHKPGLADIREAIGINDRFQFANELFNSNMTEFDIAVQQLNAAGSLPSALDYLHNLRQLYSWDMENETVKRFADLVDRRYS